jgi:hypothetical protein
MGPESQVSRTYALDISSYAEEVRGAVGGVGLGGAHCCIRVGRHLSGLG